MSFPKYPEYQDSGVEWFGGVPCDWRVQRLKQVVNPSRPITYGIVQAGENVPEGIPYIRPADMADESGVKTEDALLRTSQEIASAYRRSSISAGDIVCSIGPSFGKLMVVPVSLEGANLTQGTARVAVANEHVPRFIFWILRSVESYQQWESSVGGATFRALNLGPLAETFICVPSWAEQTQIARFLDHETARIDALIEEQQRLIELLKEKRQAVISHAVTKGLDPTVPMKDSGVEWLGEVPAHWDVMALKWRARIKSGDGISPSLIEAELSTQNSIPVIGGNGVMGYTSQGNITPPIIVIGRVGALCGNVHKIYEPAWVSDNALVLEVQRESLDLAYLAHVLNARNLNQMADKSAQPLITGSKVTSQCLPCPCLDEQRAIAAFVDSVLAEFDELTLAGEEGIELLKERRSALISAAVTGKIDVRGWQPPVSTQAPKLEVAEAN